nr:lipovitellin - African clawed frog [Xenopus laevis]
SFRRAARTKGKK